MGAMLVLFSFLVLEWHLTTFFFNKHVVSNARLVNASVYHRPYDHEYPVINLR
jgi:hypothetical protein